MTWFGQSCMYFVFLFNQNEEEDSFRFGCVNVLATQHVFLFLNYIGNKID